MQRRSGGARNRKGINSSRHLPCRGDVQRSPEQLERDIKRISDCPERKYLAHLKSVHHRELVWNSAKLGECASKRRVIATTLHMRVCIARPFASSCVSAPQDNRRLSVFFGAFPPFDSLPLRQSPRGGVAVTESGSESSFFSG